MLEKAINGLYEIYTFIIAKKQAMIKAIIIQKKCYRVRDNIDKFKNDLTGRKR